MELYKDADGKDIEPEWHQIDTTHCPDLNCDGILLYSKYYYPRKCSRCGKIWLEIIK